MKCPLYRHPSDKLHSILRVIQGLLQAGTVVIYGVSIKELLDMQKLILFLELEYILKHF
jgi:hypothetical protein